MLIAPLSLRVTPTLSSLSWVWRGLATGQAEAREALQAVQAVQAVQHVEGRLDRNRDGTRRLSFAIVGPDDLATVQDLLYATYHPYEPLTKHMGLYKGLNSLKDVDRKVESTIVKNLTLIAYDDSGKPVGAAVNNACHKEEMAPENMEEELRNVEDPLYRPIQAIHHQLRKENLNTFDEIGTDKMFSIRMIGVEVESRGQGIATNLIQRSILLAGCLGFRAIKTEVTSGFARDTFKRVGMLEAGSVKYKDFVFEGDKVFAGVDGGNSEITFMKKKFFQSSLKHIL